VVFVVNRDTQCENNLKVEYIHWQSFSGLSCMLLIKLREWDKKRRAKLPMIFFQYDILTAVLGLIRISSTENFRMGKRWFLQIWLFPDMDHFWRHFHWEKTLLPYGSGSPSSAVATLEVTLDTDLDMGNQF